MPKLPLTMIAGWFFGWDAIGMAQGDCLTAWQSNPVSESCKAFSSAFEEQNVPLIVDLDNGQCRLTAICKNQYGGGTPNSAREIDKAMLTELHNCDGYIQIGPCTKT